MLRKSGLSGYTHVGKTPSLQISRPLEGIQQALDDMHQELTTYISGLSSEALDSEIAYQNTQGISFENVLLDILVHLFNHSTHHRSQIVARMREQEIVPPETDYIFLFERINIDFPPFLY